MSLNKEQLQFCWDETLGCLGWDDEVEESGVDQLEWVRLEIKRLQEERVLWRERYYLVADAVARESNGAENLADIARQTRVERDLLRDQLRNLTPRAADETICTCSHDVYENVVNPGHCMACGKPFRR